MLLGFCLPASTLAQYSPSSLNELQVYGRLDLSLNSIRISNAQSMKTLSSDVSHIGFRGAEDLGGGVQALFKLETGIDASTGAAGGPLNLGNGAHPPAGTPTTAFFNREAYVGIKAGWGRIELGSHWGPGIWLTLRTDPFGRSQMGSQLLILQGTASRGYTPMFNNSAQYSIKLTDRVTARILLQAPEGTFNRNHAGLIEYSGDRLYAGFMYDSAQINLATAAVGIDAGAANTRSRTLAAGATYRFDHLKLWGYIQNNVVSGLRNATGYNLGISIPWGRGEFRGSLTHTGNPGKEASLAALGYTRFLSRRTQVYITVARLDNSAATRIGLFPTTADGAIPAAGGASLTGSQVGIRHFF
ncbi:MAG: porin [Delftia acidovorans]|nr:porin [Delftia acidovorans]